MKKEKGRAYDDDDDDERRAMDGKEGIRRVPGEEKDKGEEGRI